MKTKKILLFLLLITLTVTLMGCPAKINTPPKFVKVVGEEIQDINLVTYYHIKGTEFTPEIMIQNLKDNQDIIAIDYDQSVVNVGKNRAYNTISDDVVVETFYQVWADNSDVNGDEIIDETDEEFWGTLKTDEEGNYILDESKIFLLEVLMNFGGKMPFTMRVKDADGEEAQIDGEIIVVNEVLLVDYALESLIYPEVIAEEMTLELLDYLKTFGVDLSYEVDNDVIDLETGLVNASDVEGQLSVTLTVTATRGDTTKTKVFTIKVGQTPISDIVDELS